MNQKIKAQIFTAHQAIFIYQKGKGEFLRSLGYNTKIAEEVYEVKFEERLQKVRSSHCFEMGTLKTFRTWTMGNVTIEVQPDPLKLTYLGDMISVPQGDKWYQVKRFFNGNQLPLDWDDDDTLIAQRLDNWFQRLQATQPEETPVETPAPPPIQVEKTTLPQPKSETVQIHQSSSSEAKGFIELLSDLKDPNPITKINAIKQLGKLGQKEATPPLTKLLEDNNPKIRAAVAEAFVHLKDPRSIKFLIHLLKDYEPDVRFYAVTALGELNDSRALEPIKFLLNKERDQRIRSRALETFNKLT